MIALQNLNDMALFAKVVEHGGYSNAALALGMPASRLSRHVAALEGRLGVRLLNRTTRRIAVTQAGQEYYRHCAAILAEAQAAQDTIEHTRSIPQGLVRISCPVSVLHVGLNLVLADYLIAHPLVRLNIEATNRRVEVIEEGFDLALRVRPLPLEDSDLAVRMLHNSEVMLVASPHLFARHARPLTLDQATRLPTVGLTGHAGRHAWMYADADGTHQSVTHMPRLAIDDMPTLRQAVLRGLGVAQLPRQLVQHDVDAGLLEQLLPDLVFPVGALHAVFPSRRGLVPAVRALIDALAAAFEDGDCRV